MLNLLSNKPMNGRMKQILLFLSISFATGQVMAQKHVYQIRADSVRIYSGCDTAELIIENKTKDTLGFLYNKGGGRTEFRKLSLQTVGSNAIAITGQDTLQLGTIIKTSVDTIYTSAAGVLTYRKTNGAVVSLPITTTETLASVTGRGNFTAKDIQFSSTSNSPTNGLLWAYETDTWKIFVEAPQDTPAGNMIFEARDNDNEGWIFRHDGTNTAGTKIDLLSIGRDRLKYKGYDLLHTGNTSYVRGGVYETAVDWNTLVSNSFIGSVNMGTNAPTADGSWWNLISTRHRNGLTDGNNYGMQIASGMTGSYLNRIYFRSQSNNTWQGWREFWHSGNVTFGTKGAGVALKTEADGRLGLESWVRVANFAGLTTPAGTAFYQNGPANWVIASTPGTTVSYLDFKAGDTTSRGSVYAMSDNSIGFTGGSGTNWRFRTYANGNATLTGQMTATGFVQSSLRSLKKDIQPFTTNATGILKRAQVRTFIFKADSANTRHIGFIADELPEEMSAAEHNGVDQANTVALLVKSLQEMNARIEALEQEVRRLKDEAATGKHK
jgi:uncharacterized small protein (DUF1192 family)